MQAVQVLSFAAPCPGQSGDRAARWLPQGSRCAQDIEVRLRLRTPHLRVPSALYCYHFSLLQPGSFMLAQLGQGLLARWRSVVLSSAFARTLFVAS